MITVDIEASKAYKVHIGAGLLAQAGSYARAVLGGEKAAIVTDDTVDRLYAGVVEKSLQAHGYKVVKFVIASGEASKNAENYIALLNFLAQQKITRSDCVIALGGGVPGDLAGFAAATFLRGIAYMQIPTTLLAMVDSSVGGKTAIDLEAGKNLAGAFYQPDAVLCDPAALDTLPPQIFADGCAEVIKYGVILDEELFEWLKQPLQPQIERVIARCVQLKRDIVMQDEQDHGVRQLLNFGHTIGHAIEANSHFAISHGSAVAIGMCIAAKAAAKQGLCSEQCAKEIERMVAEYRLPVQTEYTAEQLCQAALSDKKRSGSSMNLILPERIGCCCIRKIPVEALQSFIEAGVPARRMPCR